MANVYTPTCVIVPYRLGIVDEIKFVMVQQKDDLLWGNPGGKIEIFDHDYLAAAAREVKEETGLSVVIDYFIGIYSFDSTNGNKIHNIVLSGERNSGSLKTDDPEINGVDYFSLGRLRRMSKENRLRAGIASLLPIEDYLRGNRIEVGRVFKNARE
ncbi:MAG: NUDIX domain-containing protein [Nanoarchaeota archaeon]